MASGKKSKQARRVAAAAPPPTSSKGGGIDLRSVTPRTWAIGGGVAALIVIGIVLAVTLGGGKGGANAAQVPTVADPANGLPGASDVAAQFKGIPQTGLTLGKPSAPVTLTEYIDLQCPFCQQFETSVLGTILTKYVRTGKVKIVARPIDLLGDDSLRGQRAMIAASLQNKAFDFAEILYLNQGTEHTGWLTDDFVASAATSVAGMNPRKVIQDESSGAVTSMAHQIDSLETADQVNATPTFYAGKSGTHGKLVNIASSTDVAGIEKALDALLP
jgi:protein-disulfide isomerase